MELYRKPSRQPVWKVPTEVSHSTERKNDAEIDLARAACDFKAQSRPKRSMKQTAREVNSTLLFVLREKICHFVFRYSLQKVDTLQTERIPIDIDHDHRRSPVSLFSRSDIFPLGSRFIFSLSLSLIHWGPTTRQTETVQNNASTKRVTYNNRKLEALTGTYTPCAFVPWVFGHFQIIFIQATVYRVNRYC